VLVELRVRDLGVIEDVSLGLGPGMTALTGETGAGKTLLVEALELLLGGRADPTLVRAGAQEAFVEGRFETGDENSDETGDETGEAVLGRSLPAGGRSRAWVDGRMSTQATLSEAGAHLVDLHGQHSHQSLLDAVHQRAALDAFAGIDVSALTAARAMVRNIDAEMRSLGGDERERAREVDLLRHQIGEITAARISGPAEDETLRAEEARLSDASAVREAAAAAVGALDADGSGVLDGLGLAIASLDGREPLQDLRDRARNLQADASELTSDLRRVVETWEDNPQRLEEVGQRRALLTELRRKYGSDLAEVLRYVDDAGKQLADLESTEHRLAELSESAKKALSQLHKTEARVLNERRAAAPLLAAAVQANLRELAMPQAAFAIEVGGTSEVASIEAAAGGSHDPAGDNVRFMLAANPGEPELPLQKVASGGELARTMLALRLVVSGGRPTLVFDEVDAGVGGAAADAVGRALAAVAVHSQVLVVTHLPQVAAFAEQQVVVEKEQSDGRTIASVRTVKGKDRVEEIARMLSGRPASASARRHAKELLEEAAQINQEIRTGSGAFD
jgi:DNA repair protein RecN (Recombination protein N)